MLSAVTVFTHPGVYVLLRKYPQIHPNRSTGEPKVRIEVCVVFFFHFMTQRQFFCYFHVFRLSLSINGIIWVSSLPPVRLQVNVFLSFTFRLMDKCYLMFLGIKCS